MPNVIANMRYFASSWANPWHNEHSLCADFSLKYGLHEFIDLTSKAEKIKNPLLSTIAQMGTIPIDFVGAIFYNLAAFFLNNTFGRIYNGIIHIKNNDLHQKNHWKIVNQKALYLDLAIGTVGLFAVFYFIGRYMHKTPEASPSEASTPLPQESAKLKNLVQDKPPTDLPKTLTTPTSSVGSTLWSIYLYPYRFFSRTFHITLLDSTINAIEKKIFG